MAIGLKIKKMDGEAPEIKLEDFDKGGSVLEYKKTKLANMKMKKIKRRKTKWNVILI